MVYAIGFFLASLPSFFRARRSLLLENLALRQQLTALKRKHPRPRLAVFDKVFWVLEKDVVRFLRVERRGLGRIEVRPGVIEPLD